MARKIIENILSTTRTLRLCRSRYYNDLNTAEDFELARQKALKQIYNDYELRKSSLNPIAVLEAMEWPSSDNEGGLPLIRCIGSVKSAREHLASLQLEKKGLSNSPARLYPVLPNSDWFCEGAQVDCKKPISVLLKDGQPQATIDANRQCLMLKRRPNGRWEDFSTLYELTENLCAVGGITISTIHKISRSLDEESEFYLNPRPFRTGEAMEEHETPIPRGDFFTPLQAFMQKKEAERLSVIGIYSTDGASEFSLSYEARGKNHSWIITPVNNKIREDLSEADYIEVQWGIKMTEENVHAISCIYRIGQLRKLAKAVSEEELMKSYQGILTIEQVQSLDQDMVKAANIASLAQPLTSIVDSPKNEIVILVPKKLSKARESWPFFRAILDHSKYRISERYHFDENDGTLHEVDKNGKKSNPHDANLKEVLNLKLGSEAAEE